jgi:tetratricopeptide (TPR) repeat protein
MIEATCSACGTLNRVSEASVPVGAKFFTCADCKARIAVPQPPSVAPASGPTGQAKPPPRPLSPAKTSNVIDLADLPAPKRASALGPIPPPPLATRPGLPAKPPVRSGLAAALDRRSQIAGGGEPDGSAGGAESRAPRGIDTELPAPKATRAGPTPAPLELDELLATPGAASDDADLLAPKRTAARPHDVGRDASHARRDDGANEVSDLLAPKAGRDITDLPAPKGGRDVTDLPAPKRGAKQEIVDLPAPRDPAKAPPRAEPVRKGPMIADVPTPRAADAPQRSSAELPVPKGFFDDLPQPALHGDAELPAPKGFFDDLPQPALHRDAELPAPKGFFDDLPQPALHKGAELPAPKGFFDDLPQPALHKGAELPAPKGFFDDLSQVESHASSSEPEVPAPKGFFDDIPGLPHTAKPEAPAPKGYFDNIPGLPHTARPELPAPKGYFDDVPGLPVNKGDDLAPRGFFDDLQDPAAVPEPPVAPRPQPPAIPGRGDSAQDLGPELELAMPRAASSFDDLDLSGPTAPPIRFERRGAGPPVEAPAGRDTGLSLDLEGSPPSAPAAKPKLPPPVKAKPVVDPATAAKARIRRQRIALVALLVVVVLGGGGFLMYRRHVAAVEREASIAEQLAIARSSYAATDPPHWQRAAAAARRVLALEDKHPEALGIAAESLLVSALMDGTAAATKIGQARATLDTAASAGTATPQIARARALAAIAANQPDGALAQLQPMVDRAPGDATLALYLGWAQAARGQAQAAIKSYDRAAADPAVKIAALYGRGSAKLALADLDGAHADFAAVLELSADHIAAQVGLAAAQPPAAAQQEADLLAILARKDIATADPRAVVQAWTLAGHAALRAGRGDVAHERFRKGLAINPHDAGAMIGLAEAELRDGNAGAAAELIAKVLAASTDNVAAHLVQSEIEIKQNKLAVATKRLAALAGHALTPLEQARMHLTTGKILELQGKDDEAIGAYAAGAKAARDLDLTPLMAAVGKLSAMTAAAVQAKDSARAEELRARSDQLLGELAAQAEQDPRLALILGMAYLQESNPAKAESWLRRAAAARPSDAEARFQLGRALLRGGKHADALEALNDALGLDPARADIGAELARTFEALGRDADAGALYTKLLAGAEPSLELRARAGRFFARTGAIDGARAQGEKILEAEPRNAAGLYLKGEGLLAAGKPGEAKQTLMRAIEIERDPQYLDALGRAAEALAQSGDREAQDLALRSYVAAAEAAPTMFHPLLGQGRLYVARHEAAKAVTPLLAAARLAPRDAEVMFLIGAAYQELEQSSTALQWLEQSMKAAPTAEAAWRIAQLYRDANQGQRAAAAVTSATRLAAQAESRTGKPVPWLTDALYLQGRIHLDLHNNAAAREAWTQYVARNPPASAQLTEVKQLLGTTLRR